MSEFPHTNNKINHQLENREFILQKFHGKFRCISWHPHYIETPWYNSKDDAILHADKMVSEFYSKTSLPEGMTCKDCINFSGCDYLFQCNPNNTECDYSPSEFRYAGGLVKGTLQKIESKDGRLFEVVDIKMRLNDDANSK